MLLYNLQIGLNDEAEKLLLSCKRFDLLNKLYQFEGRWDKSLEIAGKLDRINMKTSYYKFGKYLSEIGDISGSLAAFEKSSVPTYNKHILNFDHIYRVSYIVLKLRNCCY